MGMYLDLWDVSDGHPVAREELAELQLAQERYMKVRMMKPYQWLDIFTRSLLGDGTFDELVDRFVI